VEAKEFSREFWGEKTLVYYNGLHGVPEDCWKDLIKTCRGVGDIEDDDRDADLSILDNARAFVFNFCSPAKPQL